ncbi:uncharacterized protein LOC141511806 [Macrotis lagotis]|uniref:uncharacterized protein LOC141511806 n=1 Tax=Macrotis lagotis TaxID=92651 RepID=UPI003D684B3E
MLLPLLGICALFGRFWDKSWEPVRGLLTDDCGCGDPRCCGNLFIFCLFLIWQVRQRLRGPRKKGLEESLLRWTVPPWCHLAIPLPSPRLSICPCTQKRLEIHVQKLAHRQKWGPPQKLRDSWTQFLLSQLPGYTGFEQSGEPGICAPLFPSTCRCLEEYHQELELLGGWKLAFGFCNIQAHLFCKVPLSQDLKGSGWMEQAQESTSIIVPAPLPILGEITFPNSSLAPERTLCHPLLSIEGSCIPGGQLVEMPETQKPEGEDQPLVRDEDTLTQALGMEGALVAGKDGSESGSQAICSGGENQIYKDTSFLWGPALEDAASVASEQELEAAEGSPHTIPLTQQLIQMWQENLQDIHEEFFGMGYKAGGCVGLIPDQYGQIGGTVLELSHDKSPPLVWSEENKTLNPLPLFAAPPEDSDCATTPSDINSNEVTPNCAVPPKRPALKKCSQLLLESLMRRKIAHLKWGLPRRIQESKRLFQMIGPSLPNAGMHGSSSEEESRRKESKTQAGEPTLGDRVTQSCAFQAPRCPKAAGGAPDTVLRPCIQIQEGDKCQKKEVLKLPMPPRKRKGKNGPGCADLRGPSISLYGTKGPKQAPNLWELQDLCDEALTRAMLPVNTDSAQGGVSRKQTGSTPKDSLPTRACKVGGSQEAAEEASARSRESSAEPRPGPSNAAQRVLQRLGSPGLGASLKTWPHDPYEKELNSKLFQDSQALPWAMVCHWSMPSSSPSQTMSDYSGDTSHSHSSEAHFLPEQSRKIFRPQGGRIPESGASSYSPGRSKGPFRTAAIRLSTAFMNKMPWSLRQATSATSVSNHNQCQEDPDVLTGAESSEIPQTEHTGRLRDRDEVKGSDHRGFTKNYASLDFEMDSPSQDQSSCDDGMGESLAQAPQREQSPTKLGWVKRLRCLVMRLSFNK